MSKRAGIPPRAPELDAVDRRLLADVDRAALGMRGRDHVRLTLDGGGAGGKEREVLRRLTAHPWSVPCTV